MRRDDAAAPAAAPERGAAVRARDAADAGAERRRASRSLWAACEALLGAGDDARALHRALDQLIAAFDCEGVALWAAGPSGELEPWCARGAWRGRPGDLRDCLTVPLLSRGGRVGALELRARRGQRFRAAHTGLVRTAAGALGAALGARLELAHLRHQPGRDALTGLPDARAFHARLAEEAARARRHGVPLAVVTLDLDHFGALNARHGREVGDRALAAVALRLKLALREGDVLARLGADQFAALLPETDVAAARRCAERLRRSLEEQRVPRVGPLSASAAAAAAPRDGATPEELLAALDRALAIAKKSGRRRTTTAPPAHVH
uniref:GGDEF domain-containing protein n=1 Tax=Eiseniibacteriota bacterium TaxID=2212470 RepID=A0A832MLU2_UNCEI